MALYSKSGNEIPSDAVLLDKEDALMFQRSIIHSWKQTGDVFYAKYGSGILSGAAALTGMYVNSYYRYRLRLQSFGRLSTYFPAVVIPAIAAYTLHEKAVMDRIYIEEYQCPVCLEIKAVSLQLLSGIIYPLGLAPISSFMMASRYHTYVLPNISKDPVSVLKLFKKFTTPMINTFIGLTALQILFTIFVTYKEEQNISTVKIKLMQLEKEIDSR